MYLPYIISDTSISSATKPFDHTIFSFTLKQEQERQMVELLPSVNSPVEKTMYKSSRTPLHCFKLNHPAWGSRNLLQCVQTKPKISTTKSSPVSKPCIKAKRCKRQSFSRPVNVVVQERRVRRREGLFSLSLRNEVIEQDFICLTGSLPQRKIKVKKVYKDDEEKKVDKDDEEKKVDKDDEKEKEFIDYQKFLKEIVPGNWLSEI